MKKPRNPLDLVLQVVELVRATAPKHKIVLEGKNDVVILLESGSNEGQAIRLHRASQEVTIHFYSFHPAALEVSAEKNSWFNLTLWLKQTDVTDPFLGSLYSVSFSMPSNDFGMLIAQRRKLLGFGIEFMKLIGELRCHHIWHTQIEKTWDTAYEKLKATPEAEFIRH